MTDALSDDDAALLPPKVTEAPAHIWLNYGDIERDCIHSECARSGEVTWCEDPQDASDVQYVRARSCGTVMESFTSGRRCLELAM